MIAAAELLVATRRIDEVLADLARLRRRVDGEYGLYLLERIGDGVEALDLLLRPTAAELRLAFLAVCGDDDVATAEALRVVDARAHEIRSLLGRSTA